VTPSGRIDRDIENDTTRSRLVLDMDGLTSELVYRVTGDELVIVHTGVPDDLAGHGIGGQLVHAAIELAAESALRLVPLCPFARTWLKENPAAATGVEIDWDGPRETPRESHRPGNTDSRDSST
jgi:uncharacterized protein